MRIARVEMVDDRLMALFTFQRGLEEARDLSGHDGEYMLDQARLLAAAVAPDLIQDIPPPRHGNRHLWPERLGRVMLDHGHGDAALDYVIHYRDAATFPYAVVSALMDWYGDQERRLALLRRSFALWCKSPAGGFLALFERNWTLLPTEEAAEFVREIVRITLERPDQPTNAGYGDEGTVAFTSSRENTLFHMLSVLRHVDAPLAESLIFRHPQLAAAARRYPHGMESMRQEAEARGNSQPAEGGGFCMMGSTRDFPYLTALLQASRDGDFATAMEYALERYHEDTEPEDPNQVPREFWPSTCSFRGILYHAGIRLGEDAAVYIDQIPDPDLRLFAAIELAAALAGLPELQGAQMEQHRRPRSWTRRK